MENTIKRILLVTYLTKYNIKEVYRSLSFSKFSDYVEFFLSKNPSLNDKHILDMNKYSIEKYEEMKYLGISFLPIVSPSFPEQLKRIDQCPPMLFYKGCELQDKDFVAIIGSRETTKYAQKTIEFFIDGLNENNGVVSGLAKGVDSLAHSYSLSKNIYNVAITANSLDSIYPSENYRLANKLLSSQSTIITELAIGINRGKKSFVERNRIQSALSSIIIPIEMASKSGTMHTIDFCVRQDKWVVYKALTEEQKILEQYSGISALKSRESLKQIIVKDDFDFERIKQEINQTNKPSLFDI
ncbi:DNA-processing protein DprA [Sphingobacterium multivorum]|uniref:DNA-processing protein DprA n=1 Tax=Sphingobacterium multivorum TaxID=28454 RepID=UPI000E8D2C2B|nr:DNA-processing protein DprA [Sphingobacterium multivorum]HAF33278.1 hypothetical protein [Sphingobacterium sp.]HBI89196.1 hypothetical protein [Sphingobacterium sp.]